MSHKFGFPGMTKKALGGNPTSPTRRLNSGGEKMLCRVIDIILNENHPQYNSSLGPSQIGSIIAQGVTPDSVTVQNVFTASPSNSNIKQLPLVNEYVYVYKVPSPNRPSGKWVYDPQPVSLYSGLSPNANAYPDLLSNPTPDSQNVDYTQVENGAFNVVDPNPVEISLNSGVNPSQDTFIEKGNIHPLTQFAGDITYEGRWGQSIRFGSTTIPVNSPSLLNDWSSEGNNGDPILLIRNGQSPNVSDFGVEPVIENLNDDLSSLYLTSYQKLPFSIANENFVSYTTPPTTPSQFANPQIILNSDRIVLNAKKDSVLISGESSVGISSNNSINIEAKQVYIDGVDIRLGRKGASQAVLRGNDTVEYLKMILTELKNLTEALKTVQNWPGGVSVPNSTVLTVANTSQKIFERVYDNIDSIKSNFVKTI